MKARPQLLSFKTARSRRHQMVQLETEFDETAREIQDEAAGVVVDIARKTARDDEQAPHRRDARRSALCSMSKVIAKSSD